MKSFEALGRGYRVLALSATPGNEFDSIQEVLNNLCISKLEVKDEEDFEVK
jgi:ATP-dependent DNA helicase MPH1